MHRPTRPHRCLVLLTACALLVPTRASAAPAAAPAEPDGLAAFEAGFNDGQAKFDRGEFLAAARTWLKAAELLRETTAHRDHRVAVYEYIVDAYMRGLQEGEELEALREAATALDDYCERFTRAYGTETPIRAKILEARDDFKARLARAEARQKNPDVQERPGPVDEPPIAAEPGPARRPWKGLAIGGGVMIGLGVAAAAVAGVGGARGRAADQKFDDPANMCVVDMPVGACAGYYDDGKAGNTMVIAGAIAAPVLIGAGVGLLVVGLKRRSQPRQAVAPMLAPGLVGLGLRGSF